jgi:hypothetical protein
MMREDPHKYPSQWTKEINKDGNGTDCRDWKSKYPIAKKANEFGDRRMRVSHARAGGAAKQFDIIQLNKEPSSAGLIPAESVHGHEGKFSSCVVSGARKHILKGTLSGVRLLACWTKLLVVWEIVKIEDWGDEKQLNDSLLFGVIDRESIMESRFQDPEKERNISFSLRVGEDGELTNGHNLLDAKFTFMRYADLDRALWDSLFPRR